jgi:SAM-dependent methyltransferase
MAKRRAVACGTVVLMAEAEARFESHPGRGRFNAAFFRVMDAYIDWHLHKHKAGVFRDLPSTVVELGPGVGANLRYLPAGTRLVAIEPNPYMHGQLRRAACKRHIDVEIRTVVGERIDLPDNSADAVISSLVLCTMTDPAQVIAEIRRILRPGGLYSFIEHVVAPSGTPTRWVQHALRRPWTWVFEGCSCERDLASAIKSAGFSECTVSPYRIHSPFLPFNTHIAGQAVA